jgi:ubiquinone/menaquinone biosynthesis C-methylase UbiE
VEERLELTRRAVGTHFWFRGFRGYIEPTLHRAAAGRRDLALLDCGSGTGDNLRLLARYGRAHGVDLSTGGLAHTRSLGFSGACGDVTRLPFRSASMDIVTSFDVLQSVADDQGAVREIARVLKPGGVAILSMAALELLRGDHSEVWEELQRYTAPSARALTIGAGLVVERVTYMFASVFPLVLARRVAQRLTQSVRPHSADGDIRVPAAPINVALSGLVLAEAALARHVNMPVGSSLLVVARKPAAR